jgi:protein TonB
VIDLDMKFDIRDDEAGLFDSGDLDQPPQATSKFPPRYPPGLKSKRIGGRVIVGATVDENGVVREAGIKESSGYGDMDRAALDAIKRWRYKPAIKEGRKVRASIVQPFNFRVQ